VKRFNILTLLLWLASFTLWPQWANTAENQTKNNPDNQQYLNLINQPIGTRQGQNRHSLPAYAPRRPAATDADSVTDANKPADPNLGRFAELLEDVERESRREIQEWKGEPTKGTLRLAKVVQQQVAAELDIIRELAVEEGAVKTTAVIDRLLTRRRQRYEKISAEINKQLQQMKRRKSGDRRSRRDSRDSRGLDRREPGRGYQRQDSGRSGRNYGRRPRRDQGGPAGAGMGY